MFLSLSVCMLTSSLLLTVSVAFQLNPLAGSISRTVDADDVPWVEQVGLHPRVYYYHNFLTDEERTHMIRSAAPLMRRSTVVGANGGGVVDNIRTSYGIFIKTLSLNASSDEISMATRVPVSHQEEIQVLRYTKGQKYSAHYDSAYGNDGPGPHERLATFYMYLSDVEEGGETAFPQNSVWVDPVMGVKADATFSECAKGHVAAHAKAGDAVLFYSYFPNKTMDPASMHTGCPVIKGIKWGAPVWMSSDKTHKSMTYTFFTSRFKPSPRTRTPRIDTHIDEFKGDDFRNTATPTSVVAPAEPGLCEDYHESCAMWASAGECTRNPGFMVDGMGSCRRSCKACKPCSHGDWPCIYQNRKAGGFLDVDRAEMEWLGVPWWMGDDASKQPETNKLS